MHRHAANVHEQRVPQCASIIEDGSSGPAGLRRDTPHFSAAVASLLFCPKVGEGI